MRGRTLPVIIDGTFNREKYQAILELQVIPFSVQHYRSTESMVYQKDNCGPHRAKSIRDVMGAKQINLMTWLPQSPDLNLIKNAWAVLKKKLCARPNYPMNNTELFYVPQSEGLSISDEYFAILIRSMPTRVSPVKLNRGKSIKYWI